MKVNTKKEVFKINSSMNPLFITFPFAGGNTYSYRMINKEMPSNIDILSIELPGRGLRMEEELLSDMHEVINDIWKNWISHLQLENKVFILWGHSMGGFLAYHITLLINQRMRLSPTRLIISGCCSPLAHKKGSIHKMASSDFWMHLSALGGVPQKIIQNEDMKIFAENYIREDMKIYETYVYSSKRKIRSPTTIIYGKEDLIANRRNVLTWNKLNYCDTDIVEMEGDHFFIFTNIHKLAKMVNNFTMIPID
ncbi:thioesterase II family protein [Bacteroides ovatus]|uniref:thioesterase II family protein n=1 Tax=Bacteroides ovatus TaxID=28116 RepID=UPI000E4EB5E7|nr:thioesterase domain-containing protein [Bacteroides ovatus]RGR15254.1 thioesterase [Bacteroides ovatus]